jgi:CheY-like chemotaxis protein
MSRISVLVADDNRPIRELLTSTLAEHFRVFPAVADGRALIDAVSRRRPDVIVSDVSMPVLDGIAAMRLLKTLGCRARFVMVSAEREAGSACLEAGAEAFVCKDDLGSELVPAVLRALGTGGRRLLLREAEPLPADAQGSKVRPRANQ